MATDAVDELAAFRANLATLTITQLAQVAADVLTEVIVLLREIDQGTGAPSAVEAVAAEIARRRQPSPAAWSQKIGHA